MAAAIWALSGLYLSLGPALARSVTGDGSSLLRGLALLCLYVPASQAIVMLRRLRDRSVLIIGISAHRPGQRRRGRSRPRIAGRLLHGDARRRRGFRRRILRRVAGHPSVERT